MNSLNATLAKGHLISAVNQISNKFQLNPADMAGLLSEVLVQVQEQVRMDLAAQVADANEKLKELEELKKSAD